jgi:hypothetical protein
MIGDGRDYAAKTAPNIISQAVGWFPKVAGLRSVHTKDSGAARLSDNAYSLQLNSQDFPTPACGRLAHCAGWVQFVYQNPAGGGDGYFVIWDWLVPTDRHGFSNCPPGAGWKYLAGFCYQTSPQSVNVPNQSILELSKMSITGSADSTGDGSIFTVGGTKYAIRNAQSDNVLDLSAHWQGAEFNVLAPGNGATATFNPGTTITVGIDMRDGVTAAPVCLGRAGTTAESNNLSFVETAASAASADPSIRFTESNVASSAHPSCRALAGTRPPSDTN